LNNSLIQGLSREQVKSLDISARKAIFFEQAPKDIVEEVVDILIGLLKFNLPWEPVLAVV